MAVSKVILHKILLVFLCFTLMPSAFNGGFVLIILIITIIIIIIQQVITVIVAIMKIRKMLIIITTVIKVMIKLCSTQANFLKLVFYNYD